MAAKAVDASALAAVLFDESKGKDVADQLEGATLYAPPIIAFELANVAWKKIRKDPSRADGLRAALADFALLQIQIVPINILPTLDLALETGLSAYDSSYLLVAQSLGAELVTLDDKLAAAAAKFIAPS
jgi:predicted nucleic acid-binding protein